MRLRARVFIFDLDGTLVSLPVDWQAVREDLRKLLKSEEELSPIFWSLEKILERRADLHDEIFSALDRREQIAVQDARLLDGAPELLHYLSRRTRLALVTLQGRRACVAILRRLALKRFFPFFVAREDSLERSAQIRISLSRMGLSAKDAIFVGDRINDVNSARKAGVRIALVGRRTYDREVKADLRYADLNDLLRALLKRDETA